MWQLLVAGTYCSSLNNNTMDLAESLEWWKGERGKLTCTEDGQIRAIESYRYEAGGMQMKRNWRGKSTMIEKPGKHTFYYRTLDRLGTDYFRGVALDDWQVPKFVSSFRVDRSRFLNIKNHLQAFKNEYLESII